MARYIQATADSTWTATAAVLGHGEVAIVQNHGASGDVVDVRIAGGTAPTGSNRGIRLLPIGATVPLLAHRVVGPGTVYLKKISGTDAPCVIEITEAL